MADVTSRGFRIDRFEDGNGIECSLQESSAARDEGLVWFGCNDIGLKRFDPSDATVKGWANVELENDAPYGVLHAVNSRMHLTQSQVAALLPALTHFVETGYLPASTTEAERMSSNEQPSRAEGHYWVRWNASQNWDVMYWLDGFFWDNNDAGFRSDDFTVGPRIYPPGIN